MHSRSERAAIPGLAGIGVTAVRYYGASVACQSEREPGHRPVQLCVRPRHTI